MAGPAHIHAKVLCLGNDLLADDSLAFRVAERLRQLSLAGVEVVTTPESGFALLDHIVDVPRLLVIDTVMTGKAEAGTVYQLRETDLPRTPGDTPHTVGLQDALALGRRLGFHVPDEVFILAVEAADTLTIGGQMHPAVERTIPTVVRLARELVGPGDVPSFECLRARP